MGVQISEVYGSDDQLYQRLKNNIMFSTHVALPAVVQEVDRQAQTVSAQPTIRERIVQSDSQIQYVNYPLLINVPIVFPQVSGFRVTLPVTKGDECLVVFSDLAIDNWWQYGNVQNPVEQRRHDLSDGFAIFGVLNQSKLSSISSFSSSGIKMESIAGGTSIEVTASDVIFTNPSGAITLTQLMNHTHTESLGGNTSTPNF